MHRTLSLCTSLEEGCIEIMLCFILLCYLLTRSRHTFAYIAEYLQWKLKKHNFQAIPKR